MLHQLKCPVCAVVMEYSVRPPRFCSQCGTPVNTPAPEVGNAEPTVAFVPDPSTRIDDSSPPSRVPPPPSSVGGYRLLRALGSGGMGTVYEAEQEGTGRRVAVKLIRAEFVDSDEAVERFRREGRLASTISHPRCVFVLAAEEEEGRPYIVMELMPGRNLHDLVEERGPLPVHEAVALILDIIEGLQEAHRCGLVHRDVKPSNCFLDATGRVKVGDFGLAKSLLTEQHLTQTGAFLGTLLYAAPEQIRMDPVDHRADIYSVGATLYYLLTGRAPFQTDDAAATLARTMSDPLPPMRGHRPELPRILDEIVARALQRQPDQRYQSLEDLRLALLPFAPGDHSVGTVGWRVCAIFIDALILWPLDIIFMALVVTAVGALVGGRLSALPAGLLAQFAGLGVGLLYFALLEARFGCTVGKWCCRLRVCDADSLDRPRPSQALLRTLVFYAFKDIGPLLLILTLVEPLQRYLRGSAGIDPATVLLLSALPILLALSTSLLGVLLTGVTMRSRNGYRGVHELASGTRTIRLPNRRERRALQVTASFVAVPTGAPLPGKMGAFLVRQALNWEGERGLLLAEDSGLGRQVWIWLHGDSEDIASPTRREVGRTTRPRWVASGMQNGHPWDAFVAAPGCPLSSLVRPGTRLLWADFFPVLEQLTAELTAALEDGTLPRVLTLEQIWIEPSGRVQLLDAPLGPQAAEPDADGTRRALRLLRDACRLALEGKSPQGVAGDPRPIQQVAGDPRPIQQVAGDPRPIQQVAGDPRHDAEVVEAMGPLLAPLPGPARGLMNRLFGQQNPIWHPADMRRELELMQDRPTEVGRPRRGLHLVVQAILLCMGLSWMFLSVPLVVQGQYLPRMMAGALGESSFNLFKQIKAENLAPAVEKADTNDPAALLNDLLTTSATLKQQLIQTEKEREDDRQLVLASCSGWVRDRLEKLRTNVILNLDTIDTVQISVGDATVAVPNPAELDKRMKDASQGLTDTEGMLDNFPLGEIVLGLLLVIGFWPALWSIWAFLTRGGLSRRLIGIQLVQADGRPAGRWRCLWRSLVLWLPIVTLLLLSALVDLYRISAYHGTGNVGILLAWIAWSCWWLAALLLPVYAWLARQNPGRSVHDRLAGTYQVPA
jgi:uncharacterized RDD family membrane protein YckC